MLLQKLMAGNRETVVINWLLAGMLFFLALGFRLYDISSPAPQPDEIHWSSRARGVLKNYRERDFVQFTTHLPHPGIPAAVTIAVGQGLADRYNARYGLTNTSADFVDELTAGRVALAVVCSLTAPLIFLGGLWFFGLEVGLIAGVFLALDPHHIAASKVVHIDAMLTLLITACVLCFLKSLSSSRLLLKLLAGVLWGLAVSTKPTAILLLPALAVAKFMYYLVRRKTNLHHSLLGWSDFWTIILGLAVFCSIYTRLWHPVTRQGYKLNIWRGKRIWIDEVASNLANNSQLVGFTIVATALLFLAALGLSAVVKRDRSALSYHLTHLFAVLGITLFSFRYFPQVLKNLLGFWYWVLGLSNEQHVAYGRVWEAPPYGYLGLIVSKPPSFLVFGGIIALFVTIALTAYLLVNQIFAREEKLPADSESSLKQQRTIVLLTLGAAVVLWLLGLSTSAKQSWRYALPVVPAFILFASAGLFFITQFVSDKFEKSKRDFVLKAILGSAVAVQVVSAIAWIPNPDLFFNSVTGGLKSAMLRRSPMTFMFQNEVVDFLHHAAIQNSHVPARVSVLGDHSTLEYAYRRLYPGLKSTKERPLKFSPWFSHAPGQYLVVFESVLDRLSPGYRVLAAGEPIFVSEWWGARLVSVYRVPPPSTELPFEFRIQSTTPRKVGKVARDKFGAENSRVVVAVPGRDRNGYLLAGSYVNVSNGKFDAEFTLEIPSDLVQPSELIDYPSPEHPVVRLEFGKKCSRQVLAGELSAKEQRAIKFTCEFNKDSYVQMVAYWFGKVPVGLSRVKVTPSLLETKALEPLPQDATINAVENTNNSLQ